MGDRTVVTLTVLASQRAEARTIITDHDGDPGDGDENGNLVSFEIDEVNYGELPFLDELTQAGIAFDSAWGRGDEYGPGTDSRRFTPEGEAVTKRHYDDDEDPPLQALLALIDSPTSLRQYILNHRDEITPLPWDQQEDYGKVYRAKQLIGA